MTDNNENNSPIESNILSDSANSIVNSANSIANNGRSSSELNASKIPQGLGDYLVAVLNGRIAETQCKQSSTAQALDGNNLADSAQACGQAAERMNSAQSRIESQPISDWIKQRSTESSQQRKKMDTSRSRNYSGNSIPATIRVLVDCYANGVRYSEYVNAYWDNRIGGYWVYDGVSRFRVR